MFQSPQAITIGIFYFLMFFIVAFLAFKHLGFVDALKVLTPFLITTLLLIYDTDCLVAGGCYVYSWIRTILYLVSIIIVINIISLSLFTMSSIADAASNAATNSTTPTATPTTPTTTTPTSATTTTPPTEKKVETPTTEKFASWENFSDVNYNEDSTQLF